jgi:hypothetical protein
VRAGTFGPRLEAVTTCPECETELELEPAVDDLRAAAGADVPFAVAGAPPGWKIRARLATVADVRAAAAADWRALAASLIVVAAHDGSPVNAGELPDAVLEAVDRDVAARDAQSDLRLALTCPACDHAWAQRLDPGAYVWREIEAHARRLVGEVHALASAYGWSEAEILALPPARRRTYLEAVGA